MAGLATLTAPPVQPADFRADELTDDVRRRVAEAAYFLAEHRGFSPGHELEDWFEAERQVKDEFSLTA